MSRKNSHFNYMISTVMVKLTLMTLMIWCTSEMLLKLPLFSWYKTIFSKLMLLWKVKKHTWLTKSTKGEKKSSLDVKVQFQRNSPLRATKIKLTTSLAPFLVRKWRNWNLSPSFKKWTETILWHCHLKNKEQRWRTNEWAMVKKYLSEIHYYSLCNRTQTKR